MSLYGGINLPGRPDLDNVRLLDRLGIQPVREMMRVGMAIDKEHLAFITSYLGDTMTVLRKEIANEIPPAALDKFIAITCPELDEDGDEDEEIEINVQSSEQLATLLFDVLDLGSGNTAYAKKNLRMTNAGDRLSTGKKQLELIKEEHPVVNLILEYRACEKLKSTYSAKLPRIAVYHPRSKCCPVCERHHKYPTWRVHSQILSTRAATGRYACVAGSTMLETTRGNFRFDEYLPQIGDMVLTHRNRLRPVLRKFYKGLDKMYRVCLDNGSTIDCTAAHRFWTLHGWMRLGDLVVGDHICVSQQSLRERQSECGEGTRPVHVARDANLGANSQVTEYIVSEHPPHCGIQSERGSLQTRESAEIRQEQDRGTEPHVWEAGEPISQLAWGGRRPKGVLDTLTQWHKGNVTPSSIRQEIEHYLRCIGWTRDPSHRWQWEEQRLGQLSHSNEQGPQDNTHPTSRVSQIIPLGTQGVWDIEVGGDSSYSTQGFLSHNSKNPNLQNIPARSYVGGMIREAFIAGEGRRIVGRDLSQIELRLVAHLSNDANMITIYLNNEDIHNKTTVAVFGLKSEKEIDKNSQRAPVKSANFGIVYGLGETGLYDQLALTYASDGKKMPPHITVDWCKQFIAKWFALYPGVKPYLDLQHYRAHRYGMVWDQVGRVRHVPESMSAISKVRMAGDRQAGNMPVQGLSSSLMRLIIIELQDTYQRKRSEGKDVWLMNSIHDEALSDSDENCASEVDKVKAQVMNECMTDKQSGKNLSRVPISSSGSIMKYWKK